MGLRNPLQSASKADGLHYEDVPFSFLCGGTLDIPKCGFGEDAALATEHGAYFNEARSWIFYPRYLVIFSQDVAASQSPKADRGLWHSVVQDYLCPV